MRPRPLAGVVLDRAHRGGCVGPTIQEPVGNSLPGNPGPLRASSGSDAGHRVSSITQPTCPGSTTGPLARRPWIHDCGTRRGAARAHTDPHRNRECRGVPVTSPQSRPRRWRNSAPGGLPWPQANHSLGIERFDQFCLVVEYLFREDYRGGGAGYSLQLEVFSNLVPGTTLEQASGGRRSAGAESFW